MNRKVLRAGPFVGLAALFVGILLGTWFPDALGFVVTGVNAAVDGLKAAAPYVIFFTLTPAIGSMLKTGSAARFAVWVIVAFLAMTAAAGVVATAMLVPLFGLDLTPSEGTLGGVLSAIGVQTLLLARSSPPFIAIWYGTLVALLLHHGSRAKATAWFCRPTAATLAKVGVDGVSWLGRGVKYALPAVLLAIGIWLPLGIAESLGASGSTVSAGVLGELGPVGWYFLTLGVMLLGLGILLAAMVLGVCWYARFPVQRFVKEYLLYVYPFGWATASSAAAIPLNIERSKEALGVRAEVRDFVIPLGATVNLAGTMLGAFVVTVIAASLVGHPPTALDLIVLLVPLTIVTVGVPGIPGGLAAIAPPVVLGILPMPVEAHAAFVALFVAFGVGLSDQFRTGVNIVGDGIVALLFERVYDRKFARTGSVPVATVESPLDVPLGGGRP